MIGTIICINLLYNVVTSDDERYSCNKCSTPKSVATTKVAANTKAVETLARTMDKLITDPKVKALIRPRLNRLKAFLATPFMKKNLLNSLNLLIIR